MANTKEITRTKLAIWLAFPTQLAATQSVSQGDSTNGLLKKRVSKIESKAKRKAVKTRGFTDSFYSFLQNSKGIYFLFKFKQKLLSAEKKNINQM